MFFLKNKDAQRFVPRRTYDTSPHKTTGQHGENPRKTKFFEKTTIYEWKLINLTPYMFNIIFSKCPVLIYLALKHG